MGRQQTVTLLLEVFSYLDLWLLISNATILDPIVISSTVSPTLLLLLLLCLCKWIVSHIAAVVKIYFLSQENGGEKNTDIVTEAPRTEKGEQAQFLILVTLIVSVNWT